MYWGLMWVRKSSRQHLFKAHFTNTKENLCFFDNNVHNIYDNPKISIFID